MVHASVFVPAFLPSTWKAARSEHRTAMIFTAQRVQFLWSVLIQLDTFGAVSRSAVSAGVTAHDVLCSNS